MGEYGTIRIHLSELITESGISKNKLCHKAELQRAQLNNYCNNNIVRMDIDVLARICTVMNCQISDLLEFIPPDAEEAEGEEVQGEAESEEVQEAVGEEGQGEANEEVNDNS